jgi:hypothetical protein
MAGNNIDLEQDKMELLAKQIENDVEINGYVFQWMSSLSGVCDTDVDNIGKCASCGVWTTDCDGPDPVNGVSYGARVNGVLLCDICLPKDHPRAF